MNFRPTVVQFGAGAIGRGFVGQLWTDAGFEVVFIDVDPVLIDRLNERRAYPLRLVDFTGKVLNREIGPVRAVDGRNLEAVAGELARCTFAVTAVGVNVFGHLAPTIARGIESRFRSGNSAPLNVICCENQVRAGTMLRSAVEGQLATDDSLHDYFVSHIAFVDASVGRMVPPPTPELLAEDALLILAEPYSHLPIDGAAWIGPAPEVPGLALGRSFAGYVARKLFMHNGGHAALAYHGYRAGLTYIWEAAEDPDISAELLGFWNESGAALVASYGFDCDEQRRQEDELLMRFKSRALGDTVRRVARDPLRKLRTDDRLVGAARLCQTATPDREPTFICSSIAAALRYVDADDPSAVTLQRKLRDEGIAAVLETFCGVAAESTLGRLITAAVSSTP